MPATPSPGKALAAKLEHALQEIGLSPALLDHCRPIINGVTSEGKFVGGMTIDGFFAGAGQILLDSRRVYRHGNSLCLETGGPAEPRLAALATDLRAEPGVAALMANLLGVGVGGGDQAATQSLVPAKLVAALLASEPMWAILPAIRYYGRRPAFDRYFSFCGPGWHPGSGLLIHGPAVAPILHEPPDDDGVGALDRLPPRLRELLAEFSWRSDADLVNAVALLLTGLLISHFTDEPHPVATVDANQSGVGKTLLVQAVGRVLDGVDPPRIPLNRDEELEKRLCAEVRGRSGSILFLDNVRTRIESAVLEQNVLSPELSFRVLGQSTVIRCPNTYLWAITSNGVSGTPDIVRRGLPIRLQHHGDPKARRFEGKPLECAGRHRLAILGELAGMVMRWLQQGKPAGEQPHRCDRWAVTIGGILDACGLGRWFLANSEEAEAEMDQGMQDLAALAEHVAEGDGFCSRAGRPVECRGKAAKEWIPAFSAAQVLREQMLSETERSKSTAIGKFLAAKVDRSVRIDAEAGPRIATLRCREERANQKRYYFEISAIPDPGGDTRPPGGQAPAAPPGSGDCYAAEAPLVSADRDVGTGKEGDRGELSWFPEA
jgi:hypothetical protein